MNGRLGAVGTLIWDRIEHPSGPPVEQWGGAAYSLAALSAACPPGWSIEPIMKIGSDLWDGAIPLLRSLPHVRCGPGLVRVPEPNNRVALRYRDDARRDEVLTGGVPPLDADELASLAPGLTALYLNFISGLEMDLATAASLRRGFEGFIYADLHSLFLGPPGSGPRAPARPADWERWLACFDAVQMNEDEAALLGFAAGDVAGLLELGPSLAVVTRGGAGVSYASRTMGAGEPDIASGTLPPPGGVLDGDPTGCGDVWGATLCAALLAGVPLLGALERAHRAAAAKIRNPRIDALRDTLASSTPPYGVLP